MRLFWSTPNSGQHFVAVFDIGSGSIGGAFASIAPGHTPEIIYTTRREIPFQEELDFPRFLESMLKELGVLFEVMKKAGGGVKIDQAYCVFASPWYASQTRIARHNEQSPFPVTDKGLSKLLQREVDQLQQSLLFEKTKMDGASPVIMEAKNIRVKLNGYEVRNPIGKTAIELEAAFYISFLPGKLHGAITELIRKFWNLPGAHCSSFAFTAFDSTRDIFADEASFLFMDISGEVTDISLAQDNVLLESISFPAGVNLLTRAIIKKMKTTPAAARSELDLYLEGKSSVEHRKQLDTILEDVMHEWNGYFEKTLERFAMTFPIPRTLFYTADNNVMKWFETAIGKAAPAIPSAEDGSFAVRGLGNNFLSKFVQVMEPKFHDPFLTIEVLFANKFSSLGDNRQP